MPSAKVIGKPWRIAEVWNTTLDTLQDRPLVARNYLYASELGGSFIDRYLKMNAVKMTNPPNFRSQRKFQAGNIWEWIVASMLMSAGILKFKQIKTKFKLPRLLEVSGKKDIVAGGEIDWEKSKKNLEAMMAGFKSAEMELPPFLFLATEKIIESLMKLGLLKELIFEIKSCSAFVFDKIERTNQPSSHHVLQAFHYLLDPESQIEEAKITYICRDDCRMKEFSIVNDEETMKLYKADVSQMTKYYNEGFNSRKPLELAPPKESLIIFEDGVYRFNKNWKVEYSNYLTLLYGYNDPEHYRMTWQYKIGAWNRVFKRCVQGKNMTSKNIAALKECRQAFPDFDLYVDRAKAFGQLETDEADEEE